MAIESGFDIDWRAEGFPTSLGMTMDEYYQIFDEKLLASFERLRQNPHYCLIAGLPAPQ